MPNTTTVQVGAPTDTGPVYTVTITRDPADTNTDWTTATGVVLVMPDSTTQTVTKVSATAAQWVGTIRYNGFFGTIGTFECHARATFPSMVITVPDDLVFQLQ